jgi:hypothetical protein
MTIWYILWPFGTFFKFWYNAARKIWQPWFTIISNLGFFLFSKVR